MGLVRATRGLMPLGTRTVPVEATRGLNVFRLGHEEVKGKMELVEATISVKVTRKLNDIKAISV